MPLAGPNRLRLEAGCDSRTRLRAEMSFVQRCNRVAHGGWNACDHGCVGKHAVDECKIQFASLAYSDSVDGSAPYVSASYNHDAARGSTPIFQNEQFVTLKAPDANYSTSSPNVQGDDSTGDVKSLIGNTTNSVATYLNDNATACQPRRRVCWLRDTFFRRLMQVEKAQNGFEIRRGFRARSYPTLAVDKVITTAAWRPGRRTTRWFRRT